MLLPTHISHHVTFLKWNNVWQQETKSDADEDFRTALNLCSISKARSCPVSRFHATPHSLPKETIWQDGKKQPWVKSYSFQWRHWEVQPLLNNRTASCHLGFLFFSYGTFTIHGLLNLWKRRRGEPQQYLIWSLENQKFLPLFPISCYKTHQLDTYFCQCSEDYFTGSRV